MAFPECDQPAECVNVKSTDMDEFMGKDKVKPEQQFGVCEVLADDNELEIEDSTNPTDMITL